ncbi:MAG: polysaccharide deacetylase family protein [Acidimicrobiia bacterium]
MPSSLLQRAVKTSAAAADRLRRPRRGVVVLLYHRVGARSRLEVDLPRELFETQMEILAADSRATSLDDALRQLDGDALPARDPVVVSFDDGTADFAEVALPILERLRIPALVYVTTDFVEHARPFPHDGTPLSWEALRDALSTGLVSVGSHTHSHALLDRVPPEEAEHELDRSIDLIGERLDIRAEHFAYPKAVRGSPAAEAAVRRRFRSAALAGTRPNRYGRTDHYRLARSPIQVADGIRWFRHKAAGGMGLEDDLRRLLDRRRYARMTR